MSQASKASSGAGTLFSISTDGTTFTLVNQVQTISYSGGKLDLDDITSMSSPGAAREFLPTLLDNGNVQLAGVFNPEDQGQLLFNASYIARKLVSVKHVYPTQIGETTGFTRTYQAYVTAPMNPDASFDKATKFSASLKVTGVITDTPPVMASGS